MINHISKMAGSVILTGVLFSFVVGALFMGASAVQGPAPIPEINLTVPTSTLVIIRLTSAADEQPKAITPTPTAATPTATPDNIDDREATPTRMEPTATQTQAKTIPPTSTLLSSKCQTPSGWIPYLVRSGDNLYRISLKYRLSTSALQQANCMGNRTAIIAGERLWVPNVATSTPVASPTATRQPTAVPVGTSTATQPVIVPTGTSAATQDATLAPDSTETPAQ